MASAVRAGRRASRRVFLACALLAAGTWWPAANGLAQGLVRPVLPAGLDLHLPVPDDNPVTGAKVALGGLLFRDPLLSRDRSLACAGCHDPERAFTDGRALGVGVFDRVGSRNVPTLLNRAYGRSFFWDGRTTTLEEQVLRPIEDPREMDLGIADAIERLQARSDYARRFQEAFGGEPTAGALAQALASYVRTIVSGGAPFDRYARGAADALSADARAGLRLFRGRANCVSCHRPPLFSDERFHNTGVAWQDGVLRDLGRAGVTGDPGDRGAFKTPTLREVARTAPYMHDGSIQTLEAVIEFYDRGGNVNPYRDPQLSHLALSTREKQQLLSFLRSLNGVVQEGLPGQRRAGQQITNGTPTCDCHRFSTSTPLMLTGR